MVVGKGFLVLIALALISSSARAAPRFEITLDRELVNARPRSGRMLVVIANDGADPSFTDVRSRVAGIDVNQAGAGSTIVIDDSSMFFPSGKLSDLPAGRYTVQAVFAIDGPVRGPYAPGNRICAAKSIEYSPERALVVKLVLDQIVDDPTPPETATHKYLRIPSRLLSEFHGRPMVLRVGVVLPEGFERESEKRYGLVVRIGGFGQRYFMAGRVQPDSRFVQIMLDGAGPFGDPYQVNSANNGPYGDALIREVIPHVEAAFQCVGTPKARFTAGMSTGGWVSLALQVFHPESFNGCWSQAPDGVDFRAFQLIDIYSDQNAYVNRHGFERPAKRTIDGDTEFTTRHECRLEQVLGRGGRWELSGQQWGSWNAVYGPKGRDGLPTPLWDGATGAMNREAASHWERYDLRLVMEREWKVLGPKLAGGKINIWVGDADDYFLNNAVHRLAEALEKLDEPRFDGNITIQPRAAHVSGGWTDAQMLEAMARRAGL